MFIHFPSAVAVVLAVEFVVGVVQKIGVVLCGKLAVRLKQSRLIHWPLLDWGLLLLAVMLSISSSSVGVKGVTVRMQIVPCCQLRCLHEVAFVECSMSAVSLMRESHWMLIKFSNRHHLLVISRMGEMVLDRQKNTPYVVTPNIGP